MSAHDLTYSFLVRQCEEADDDADENQQSGEPVDFMLLDADDTTGPHYHVERNEELQKADEQPDGHLIGKQE